MTSLFPKRVSMNILVNCHEAFYLGLLSQVCRCLNALKDLSQLLTGMVSAACMIWLPSGMGTYQGLTVYTHRTWQKWHLLRYFLWLERTMIHVCLVWVFPVLCSLSRSSLFHAVWNSAFPESTILLQRMNSISTVAQWSILNTNTESEREKQYEELENCYIMFTWIELKVKYGIIYVPEW